jgi:hypothetical protein
MPRYMPGNAGHRFAVEVRLKSRGRNAQGNGTLSDVGHPNGTVPAGAAGHHPQAAGPALALRLATPSPRADDDRPAAQRYPPTADRAVTFEAGPSVSLHDDTTAEFDGGESKWTPKSMKRSSRCSDCPDECPCLRGRHIRRDLPAQT